MSQLVKRFSFEFDSLSLESINPCKKLGTMVCICSPYSHEIGARTVGPWDLPGQLVF